MGCFKVLKSKKKRCDHTPSTSIKRVTPKELTPTTLPEPQIRAHPLQSAPSSFRTRAKPTHPINKASSNRIRALSAPSSLDADGLSSDEYDEQEESKIRLGYTKEQRSSSSPQPLPLPSPHIAALKTTMSFKSGTASGPIFASGPLPLPPTGTGTGTLRNFPYEEVASACLNFSSDRCMSEGLSSYIYRASFGNDASTSKRFDATVTRLHPSTQSLKEFIGEVNTLAALQHPNLCKLLGFHAREGSDQRMLVYERLFHGSLDRILYGGSDGPPIDWNTRMKIALCASQGLTFLHEEGPLQAMYSEFSTASIQIDKDFSAKLSGYGCVGQIPETEISNSLVAVANLSVETLERGLLTPKSNVWSFGIVLLELLTGRRNLDSCHPKEERNLVKWTRPFLTDDCRLSLIMDPQLKGRFPSKAARTVADIAQKCLQKDPSERPTMRTIVEHLKIIQDMKYSCRFPLQEPARVPLKQMYRSPSLNGMVVTPVAPRFSYSPSPPSLSRPLFSHTRPLALPLSLPPRACSSSTLSFDELERQESRRSSGSSGSAFRRSSIEGF